MTDYLTLAEALAIHGDHVLLRGRRVPATTKLIALGIGAAAIARSSCCSSRLIKAVIAALLPFVGAAGGIGSKGINFTTQSDEFEF